MNSGKATAVAMVNPGLLIAKCDPCDAFTSEFIDPDDPEHVTCKGCGAKLTPIIGPATMMDGAMWKGGMSKSKGLLSKMRVSFEPQHSRDGAVAKHERIIDRSGNRYFEKVTMCETGEVVHERDEPLTDHMGHGSAKKKPPK